MLCSIILFDKRFIDLDLDVIGGIHCRGKGMCLDIFCISKTCPRYKQSENISKYEFLIVPQSIDDVLPGTFNLGQVWADYEVLGLEKDGWWHWRVDWEMAEMVINEYIIRCKYLKKMEAQAKYRMKCMKRK